MKRKSHFIYLCLRLQIHHETKFRIVFCASQFQGNPSETDEAEPFWCSFDQIPYEQMWADDALWLPGMLSGKKFDGEFVFDGELMLWSNLRWR